MPTSRLSAPALAAGLVVLCGVACSASEEPEIVYDPCAPLELSVSSSTSASVDELAGVTQAIEAWRAQLPVQIRVGTGTQASDVLPIHFISDSVLRAVYWDARGTISINRDLLAPADYGIALAHELGHAFGLPHIDDRPSVMNVGNLELAPTDDDAAEVAARWASCSEPPPAP